MKPKSIFNLLLLVLISTTTWSQISMESHNQVKVNLCDDEQDVLVVDSIILYEPAIGMGLPTFSTDNPDFQGEFLGFSTLNPDTAYIRIKFNHNTTPLGAVAVEFTYESGIANITTGNSGPAKTIFTHTFNFILHGNPTSINSASIGNLCSSDVPFDLTSYASPSGGFFEGPGLTNGSVFDPSLLQNSTDSIRYIYEDGTNGCIDTAFWNFNNNLQANPTFNSVVSNDASGCSTGDGSIDITPGGGATSYTASIATGDTISILSGNSGTFTGLNSGHYLITVTDANGCSVTTSESVSSSDLNISGIVTNPTCTGGNDGAIDVTITATSSYTFYWEHGNINNEDLNGLSSGTYTLNAFDDNGCEVSKTFSVQNPNTLHFNPSNMYIYEYGCSDFIPGEIYASADGVGALTYSFSPAGGTVVDDSVYVDLNPGDYTVEVTDANGCTIDTTITIAPSSNWDNYATLVSSTPSNCSGSDGILDIDLVINYAFDFDTAYWSHGPEAGDLSGLAPGTYTLIIENTFNATCDAAFDFVVEADQPQYNDICLLTVDSMSSTNVVVWEKAQMTGIDHYNIYRENSLGVYQKIAEVPFADESLYNDTYASPLVKSWKYKISAVNDCGVEGDLSTAHRTIHLRENDLGSGDFELVWNNYVGFPYTNHDIWRFTGVTGWELIASVPYGQTSYLDTPPSLSYLDYAIEVTSGFVCTSEKATSHNASRSNRSQGGIFNPGNGLGTGSMPSVSLEDNEQEYLQINLYPNPTNGVINVVINKKGSFQIELFASNGQLLQSKTTNSNITRLENEDLANGIYFVKITGKNGSKTEKLIINK